MLTITVSCEVAKQQDKQIAYNELHTCAQTCDDCCTQLRTCPQVPAANCTIKASGEYQRLTWMTAQRYYSLHEQNAI